MERCSHHVFVCTLRALQGGSPRHPSGDPTQILSAPADAGVYQTMRRSCCVLFAYIGITASESIEQEQGLLRIFEELHNGHARPCIGEVSDRAYPNGLLEVPGAH